MLPSFNIFNSITILNQFLYNISAFICLHLDSSNYKCQNLYYQFCRSENCYCCQVVNHLQSEKTNKVPLTLSQWLVWHFKQKMPWPLFSVLHFHHQLFLTDFILGSIPHQKERPWNHPCLIFLLRIKSSWGIICKIINTLNVISLICWT